MTSADRAAYTEGAALGGSSMAVRAWTAPVPMRQRPVKQAAPEGKSRPDRRRRKRQHQNLPRHALVVDTETTTDSAQGLLFGVARYCRLDPGPDGPVVTTVAEVLFHNDNLAKRDPAAYRLLVEYAIRRRADVDRTYLGTEPLPELLVMSRGEMCDRWLYRAATPQNSRREPPALLVMFNAPFDLTRIAAKAVLGREDMRGGFSLLPWVDSNGDEVPWRPRIAYKSIDSKRALKKFRKTERGGPFDAHANGHILDLRTLVFALTGESHSLNSACAAFELDGKSEIGELGTVTTEAVAYCRNDVKITTDLLEAVLREHERHPIPLQATKAYSPASVAKGYLTGMGILPRLALQPDFDPEVLGACMSAFYGGRAEVHVRRWPVPVSLLDVTSMYPTVNCLMDTWPLVAAARVEPVGATAEVQQLLDAITVEGCFDPDLWPQLVGVAQIVPDGDVLPVRADYDPMNWSIGLNPLHTSEKLWYSIPDLIVSTLLTGRPPRVLQAVQFTPARGPQPTLVPSRLRDTIDVDPMEENFFRKVIEERQTLKTWAKENEHGEECRCETCRTHRFLKVLANAGSYGIFAEMIREELPARERERVTVHAGGNSYEASVPSPEKPGQYCFPPVAAAITGAARLMLALIEIAVTELGGTWVFCDTDSLAVVATLTGGLIQCPGGPEQLPDGADAIRALRHDQVQQVQDRLNRLNPYDRSVIPAMLKLEGTGTCYAISAKRYAIYTDHPDGREYLKFSQHGLGRYMDPLTPDDERRDELGRPIWIRDIWDWIVDSHDNPDLPLPEWASRAALSRVTISSPTLLAPFDTYNESRPYDEQIKPANFLLAATLDPFDLHAQTHGGRFRLIGPYSSQPDDWPDLLWRNHYDPHGPGYRITTDPDEPLTDGLVLVQSYRTAALDFRVHPEHKANGPDGNPCSRGTHGLLPRRTVRPTGLVHIGKEANSLHLVRAGLVSNLSEVTTTYGGIDSQLAAALKALEGVGVRERARLLGVSPSTVSRIWRDGQRPGRELAERIVRLAGGPAPSDARS